MQIWNNFFHPCRSKVACQWKHTFLMWPKLALIWYSWFNNYIPSKQLRLDSSVQFVTSCLQATLLQGLTWCPVFVDWLSANTMRLLSNANTNSPRGENTIDRGASTARVWDSPSLEPNSLRNMLCEKACPMFRKWTSTKLQMSHWGFSLPPMWLFRHHVHTSCGFYPSINMSD